MTLSQLRYVVSVARHLSFGRAAQECGIAQPSLSVQIKNLEEEIGTPLFDRNQKGVRLTELGEQILKQAHVILSEVDRLGEIATDHQKVVHGTLRLGIIPTIAPYLTPYFISALIKQYPELEVKVFEQTTAELVRDLGDGRLDAAILSTPEKVSYDLIERVLYYEPFVLFAHAKHHFLESVQVKTSRLQEESPLLLDETHCLRDQVEGICHTKKLSPSQVQLEQGTLQTLLTLVDQQPAYTLLPILAAEALTPEQRKKQVRALVGPVPNRKVSLVFNKSYVKRSLVEALERVILEHLPDVVENRLKSKMNVLNPSQKRFKIPPST
ncbi:MAG: LysR substrate-binding domain-containing protein [Bdellovibrio sp.]